MAETCEIPRDDVIYDVDVNDDPPTADAMEIADSFEVLDNKGEKHTLRSIYGGPDTPRRVLVVFVRHFFCGVRSLCQTPLSLCSSRQACVNYTKFLSENTTPEKLKSIVTAVILIGHSGYDLIDMYTKDTGWQLPIYVDPTGGKLYDALGMVKTWVDGNPSKYSPESSFWIAFNSLSAAFWKALGGYPLHRSGKPTQQGGEFLFEGEGEEKTVTWCHRMRGSRDHTDTDEILEVLGVGKE
ncbi:hypothetical protein FZEAL_3447 [Fusarium zealandicum]|uniref:Uncharacterized protein n=1 Tax=Fusarium zealandicum TaxID=1053134 RepID=A0A8H4UP65_9HYPO|nr:hypothetical protein FZEAL_3447 [Fusarium zealandicum]